MQKRILQFKNESKSRILTALILSVYHQQQNIEEISMMFRYFKNELIVYFILQKQSNRMWGQRLETIRLQSLSKFSFLLCYFSSSSLHQTLTSLSSYRCFRRQREMSKRHMQLSQNKEVIENGFWYDQKLLERTIQKCLKIWWKMNPRNRLEGFGKRIRSYWQTTSIFWSFEKYAVFWNQTAAVDICQRFLFPNWNFQNSV